MTAQHPVADGMKRSTPNSARIHRQQIRDSIEHLSGGFVRKREQQNVARIDSVLGQIGDPIGERARLPRARTSDDKQRPGRRRYSRELLFVQLGGVIDMDRCRSWRALQRVLAGHNAFRLGPGYAAVCRNALQPKIFRAIASCNRPTSAFPFAADFFEQLDLDLLNLKKPIVLPPQQVIDFFMEMADFEFGFEINFVIVLRAQPVARFHAVLAHHDDWRLEGSKTGKDQIKQDKWERIESAGREKNDVDRNPKHDHYSKRNDEFPTSAK